MGKSRDVRFIKRVFTEYEERLISIAETPDKVLWTLWAAKEASYKAVSKSHPSANSIPHRYEVHLESADQHSETWGNVLSPYGSIEIRLSSTDRYIHCVGISEGKADWNSVVSKVGKYQFE
ncbi:MAG: 4-phosphopantetheinyl transferase family protein, partial [Deltaproteobacteria bacterium]|nr:4-phosphopantetheinyl transferase family protein [Deltaproteobacteria bacterium]